MTTPIQKRSKSIAKKMALAILAPTLFLGAAEGVLRLANVGPSPRFFEPTTIRGAPCWANNPFYGYRFFTPELARNPPPFACANPKPSDVVRIVVLGESAAMGDPIVEFGAPRMLEKMLNHAGGPSRFEVVNAAMTAINSPVVADIASELDRLQPDVVLIYMGNNEVVGPFGPSVHARSKAATRLVPLRAALTRWRVPMALRMGIESLSAAKRDPRYFQMDDLGQLLLPAGDSRLESVYALYENRLDRIVSRAHEAGAQVLLCTMAVNLTDCPPFASVNRLDWNDEDRGRWNQAFANGRQAQSDGRTDDAIAAYRTAAQIDGGHAELAYRFAQTLAESGQTEKASHWYSQARNSDARRFRADQRINRILRKHAQLHRVRLVDAEQAFIEQGRDSDLFLDHVHFTIEGTYQLAGAWFAALADMYPHLQMPTLDTCRERLLFTPWGERRQIQAMATRFARAPFTRQLDNAQRQEAMAASLQRCARAIASTNLYFLGEQYRANVALDPYDPFYSLQWGSILLDSRRIPEALPLLMDYAERLPHHFEARMMPAFVLAKANQPDQAVTLMLGSGPPYGKYLAEHSLGVIEALLADGFRREARLFGQSLLDRQRAFAGRDQLVGVVARL